MELFNNIYNSILEIINTSQIYGPLFACFLIFIESIVPVLPLFVFITIVFLTYGYVWGFLISYILTCLGCFLAFYLCRGLLKNVFKRRVRKIEKFDKLMQKIDNLDCSCLVLLTALPFTPAFLINVAAGLSEMSFKKYAVAIIIGKISLIFFWGFIGTSLVESLKDPQIIVIILVMLGLAYLLSKIVCKKLNLD